MTTLPLPETEKPRRKRAPADVTDKRGPTDGQFSWACEAVEGMGEEFLDALKAAIGEGRGRPGSVPARAALVACFLLVTEKNHLFEYTDVAAQLVACTPEQLRALGMSALPVGRAYNRVHDKVTRIFQALNNGFDIARGAEAVRVDLEWFAKAAGEAGMDPTLPTSQTRSVDGKDWESCGGWLHAGVGEYDGETPADTDMDPEKHRALVAKIRKRAKHAKFTIGPDGRPIYTKDNGARAGHRSSNSRHKSESYNGYELHLATQVRDITWYGHAEGVHFGPDVPGYVTMAALTPAGSHRPDAVVPALIRERVSVGAVSCGLQKVMWDRGYSIHEDARTHAPLRLNGIGPVFDLATWQRTYQNSTVGALWIDGHPFSIHTPERLRSLPRPDRHASEAERRQNQALYNERALWRYSVHARPDTDGYQRMKCPFCAGRLRSRQLTGQRGVAKRAPLVELPEGTTTCCEGVLQVPPTHVRSMQADGLLFGTTAWAQAYGQRNLVETSNSLLAGAYVHLDRGYTKLKGLAKRRFAMAFMIAGLNRYIGRSWRALQAAIERQKVAESATRKRRRTSTLASIVAGARTPSTTPAAHPTQPPTGTPPGTGPGRKQPSRRTRTPSAQ